MTTWTDLALAFIYLTVLLVLWWYWSIPKDLPPGPRGWPLVGSCLDTWTVATLFPKLMRWTEEYGPVYRLYVGGQLVVILGDHDATYEALVKQGDVYSGRPDFYTILADEVAGAGLLNTEGELWKTQHRFSLAALRDFGFGRSGIEPRIRDEAEYLLEAIAAHDGRKFDISPLLGNAVSNVISSLVYGRRFSYDDEQFQVLLSMIRSRLSTTPFSLLTPVVLSKSFAKILSYSPAIKNMKRGKAQLFRFLTARIQESMQDFRVETDEATNYVQAFYKAKYERPNDWTFTDRQLAATVGNLFVGGTDTTATTLLWTLFYLSHYPHIQERVYQEILKETGGTEGALLSYADRTRLPYTEAMLYEASRMANLVPINLLRRTTAESELRGYRIPKGTIVAALLGASLNDPNVYPNPHVFEPERFLGEKEDGKKLSYLIPFGTGKRVCIGAPLARMEMFIFTTALLSRYRFYFPTDEPKPPLDGETVSINRAPVHFTICAERRQE